MLGSDSEAKEDSKRGVKNSDEVEVEAKRASQTEEGELRFTILLDCFQKLREEVFRPLVGADCGETCN